MAWVMLLSQTRSGCVQGKRTVAYNLLRRACVFLHAYCMCYQFYQSVLYIIPSFISSYKNTYLDVYPTQSFSRSLGSCSSSFFMSPIDVNPNMYSKARYVKLLETKNIFPFFNNPHHFPFSFFCTNFVQ